jgi:hypothetical protein
MPIAVNLSGAVSILIQYNRHKSEEYRIVEPEFPGSDQGINLYRKITRTRQKVEIWAGKDVLMKAISRRISRQSGLSSALRNSEASSLG